jgi:hypothetical protein
MDPHADTLRPLDRILADLATRRAGGLRAVTVDEVTDLVLDARNDLARTLDSFESAWRAAFEFIDATGEGV